MSFSLSIESLIKSTEHALNVTQGEKTTQNKIKPIFLSKEIYTESFKFSFLGIGCWAQGYGYG